MTLLEDTPEKRCPKCKRMKVNCICNVPPDKLKIPCEVYSRVVGYYRPVSNWNLGKQEEFRQRKEYIVK